MTTGARQPIQVVLLLICIHVLAVAAFGCRHYVTPERAREVSFALVRDQFEQRNYCPAQEVSVEPSPLRWQVIVYTERASPPPEVAGNAQRLAEWNRRHPREHESLTCEDILHVRGCGKTEEQCCYWQPTLRARLFGAPFDDEQKIDGIPAYRKCFPFSSPHRFVPLTPSDSRFCSTSSRYPACENLSDPRYELRL